MSSFMFRWDKRCAKSWKKPVIAGGLQREAFGKWLFPEVWKTKKRCHSRIKRLGGLPDIKETRAGKRNKRKFCKDSAVSYEWPLFKG